MAARELEVRTKVWVGPSRRLEGADGRSVEIRASVAMIEYPDLTSGAELDNIIAAAARLIEATNGGTGPGKEIET